MLVHRGDLISVDTQPYIIAATRDLCKTPFLISGVDCLYKTRAKLQPGCNVLPCVEKEEGGDAYLECLISFAAVSARQIVTRCLPDMTKSGIGLIQSRMSLALCC
jgi:hypothetical protein